MSSATKKPQSNHLDKHAEEIRKELQVTKQNEVFKNAVEAGYLAALGDGEVDDGERAALVKAIGVLSVGAVIEWEADHLIEECAARIEKEGAAARAKACGAALKALGHPQAGLLFAAVIAQATGGIDGRERKVLEQVGEAAGMKKGDIGPILRKAGVS